MKGSGKVFGVAVTVIVLILLIFIFPPDKPTPGNTPTDYYEIRDEVVETNPLIYTLEADSVLPPDIATIQVNSLYGIPKENTNPNTFIVIDLMNMTLSESNQEFLVSLYEDHCYKIILLNYAKSESDALGDYVDERKSKSNITVLEFLECGGMTNTSAVSFDYDTIHQYQYIVMDVIRRRMVETDQQ